MNYRLVFCLMCLMILVGIVSADTLIVTSGYSRTVGERTDGTFYAMRNDAGDLVDQDAVDFCGYTVASTTTDVYTDNWRCAIRFDTSNLTSGATITSAKLSIYRYNNYNNLAPPNPSIQFIDFSPTSSSAFAATDYSKTTFTATTDSIGIVTFDGLTWANFTLNAAGLAAINKTGFTNMLGDSSLSISNTSPTWASAKISGFMIQSATGVYKPFITITYTTTVPPVASFTTTNNFIRIPGTLQVNDTSSNTPTSWNWSFGDGDANITTQNATHKYRRPGIFTIDLTAVNAGGSSSNSTTVRVIQGGFQFNPKNNEMVSCDDFTYSMSRELTRIERIMTDVKIFDLCYGG